MTPRSTWATRYAWIVDELAGGNRSDVARALGVTPQAVANILQSGAVPSGDTLAATLAAFPTLSARWLLTGEGPREHTQPRAADAALEEIAGTLARLRKRR